MRKFLLVMMMCVGLSCSNCFAKEYSVTDMTLKHQDESRAIVSFVFNNNTNQYNSNLYYIPKLSLHIIEDGLGFIEDYMSFEAVPFTIGANEQKEFQYECKFPENLPSGDYVFIVDFYEKSNKIFSGSAMMPLEEINSAFETDIFSIDEFDGTQLLVDGVKYHPLAGFIISKTNKVQAELNLRLDSERKKTLVPKIIMYKRNAGNEVIIDTMGEPFTLQPNEDKTINIDLPMAIKPESYWIEITLLDEKMRQVSRIYKFRYVLEGVSGNITHLEIIPDQVVAVGLIGPADATSLENCEIVCNVYDSNKQLLITKSEKCTLDTEEKEILFSVNEITGLDDKIQIEILVKYNGELVTTKKSEIVLSELTDTKLELKDLVDTKYEDAVNLLVGLGIVSGYPDGTFRPSNPITRAEFTVIADKLAKIELGATATTFNDVDTHWAKEYIENAAKFGFLSGYPDGTFRPNNLVTYSESLTILLNMLGYKEEVNKSNFRWPDNYINKAKEINLIKDVEISNYGDSATRGDIAIMALNAYLLM